MVCGVECMVHSTQFIVYRAGCVLCGVVFEVCIESNLCTYWVFFLMCSVEVVVCRVHSRILRVEC